jgi:LmbE family N-acetylglucosaminyl deacetylase
LKIDTVLSFDPWGHYEENPDHYITAQEVEAACWMAGGRLDLPEHFEAGLSPHSVKEKYYWARGPQLVNRVVDISDKIEIKVNAICANKTQIWNMVQKLRDNLAGQGLTLSWFDDNKESAIKKFTEIVFKRFAEQTGKKYDLKYAETFHYIGPNSEPTEEFAQYMEQYIKENSLPLK